MKEHFGKIKLENQNDFQKERTTELSIRFNRWHDKQLYLSTFLINLFFTLSIVTLGFVVNNFKNGIFDEKIYKSYSLGKVVSIILLISIIIGTLTIFFRLYDFRYTKTKVKFRKRKFQIKENLKYTATKKWSENLCQIEIDKYDYRIKRLGKLTWSTFYFQVVLYLFALTLIISNL
jgi:hypothetical protein